MKYKNEVVINAPRETVVALFDDPAQMKEWQPGFVSMELIEGDQGQVGAKQKLHYKMGKRDIEMIETITARNLPENYTVTYKAKGVFNIVDNHFEDLGDKTTRYTTLNEFKMKGFMKFFAWLMPGAFKKQSQKYMEDFKAFVEREASKS